MVLNPDFKEFLQLLNEHEVRYMVIGGYAVAHHGHPRYTKDLDVWLWVSPDNAKKIIDVLNAFGFGSIGLTEKDFLNAENVVQLGYPPVRIDMTMSISGLAFEDCYERRDITSIDDITINFIGLSDLKINKLASGRKRDLDDVENLE
ncbi:MAG: DUF6036 family nucleotidyltransferase [Bacteroidota bacterium]